MRVLAWTVASVCLTIGCDEPAEPPARVAHTRQSLTLPPFQERVVSTAFQAPWGKSVGDIDGDGRIDILVQGRNSGGLSWLKAPDWTELSIHATAQFLTDLEVADLDQDGDSDVVTLRSDGIFIYYQQQAAWTASRLSSATMHDVEVADLDGDGDIDVVTRNQGAFSGSGASFHVFRNQAGEWSESSIACSDGEGLKLSDLDADGDPDVVVNQQWFENTDAGWQAHAYTNTWTHPHAYLDVADINADGRLDIVAAPAESQGGTHRISWFEAPVDRRQVWTEHVVKQNVETVIHFVGTGDFNRDGHMDIAAAEMSQSSGDDLLSILYNDAGAWTEQVLSLSGSHSMRVFDADADGDLDLLGANWQANGRDESVKLWINGSIERIPLDRWQRHSIDADKPERSLWVGSADVDEDGQLDVLTGAFWYENPGTIAGSWTRNALGGPLNNVVAAFDRDLDGHVDVLASQGVGSESNGAFAWGKNDGTGTFQVFSNVATGSGDFLQGLARLNDAVALSWHAGAGGVELLGIPENPAGAWPLTPISGATENEALTSSDIDGDGDLDLFQGSGWLRNDGASWTRIVVASLSGPPDRHVLADIDADGDLDAVVGFDQDSADLIWLERPEDPEASWPVHPIAENVGGGYSLDAGDLDHDGDIDVVLGEHRGARRVLVFENLAAGSAWAEHVADGGGAGIDHHVGTQLVDLDADGDQDIISIGWDNPGGVWILENLAISAEPEPEPEPEPPGGAHVIPQEGLLAHWALDEGVGSSAGDSSDGDHDGSISGAVWGPGRFGSALSFDGVDDYVDVGSFDIPGAGLTIAAWIRPEGFLSRYMDNRILSKATGDQAQQHYWMLSSIRSGSVARLRFRLKTGGSTQTLIASSGDLRIGEWQHVAATYDGSRMRLWLDGVEVGSTAKSGSLTASSASINIGRNPNGYASFDGSLDDVLMYERALTAEELADLASGAAPPENQAPQVSAGADQSLSFGEPALLSGSASDDGLPNQSLVTTWSLLSGPGSAVFADPGALQTSATLPSPGNYVLRLSASDGEFDAQDDVSITVLEPANAPPSAAFVSVQTTVSFDASESFDLDGSIASFHWDFGDGTSGSGRTVTHSYEGPGSYVVVLTVTDDEGSSATVQALLEAP